MKRNLLKKVRILTLITPKLNVILGVTHQNSKSGQNKIKKSLGNYHPRVLAKEEMDGHQEMEVGDRTATLSAAILFNSM